MKQSVRAVAFKSKYLRDFSMVDERHGSRHLFPATEQLPALSRAIDEEFKAGLTSRLAATDGRADSWRKLQLWKSGTAFCQIINSERPDHLHIQPVYTPEFVTRIAVVQHITQSESGGNRHWFRAYRDNAFLPDIYLSGKRVSFSSHAIERYNQRSTNNHVNPTVALVSEFFYTVITVVKLNDTNPALAIDAGGTLAVLPFEETATGFFILTTLSPHEVIHLAPIVPMRRLYLHYGPAFTQPAAPIFNIAKHTGKLLERWRRKQPLQVRTATEGSLRSCSWTSIVQLVNTVMHGEGFTEASRLLFHDGVYGPTVLTSTPTPPAVAAA